MASVTELLLETLKYLSDTELGEFSRVLHGIIFHRNLNIPRWLVRRDRQQTVFTLMLYHGRQSVEMIKDILEKMKRTDLVQRLSDSSSQPQSKTIKTKVCLNHTKQHVKCYFFIMYLLTAVFISHESNSHE